MESKIQVPNNIEDKTVLKRFLTQLVLGINSNPLFSSDVAAQNQALVNILQTNPNVDFLNVVSKLNELRTDILTYVEENVETIILQQQEDIAVIAEQFGTFYQQALAASWYGLSVKAGGAVAGLEVGSLDPDVTTPGDENSYFRVIADNFIVGRAYEDLTQEEKDYLTSNNLPSFGTVYNEDKTPVPALIITWDSVNNTYKHYFNGIVNFVNVETNTGTLDEVLAVQTSKLAKLEETDDGVVHSFYQTSAPSTSVSSYGDWWVDTDSNPLKAYRYEDINGKNVGTLAWRDNSTSIIGKAYISAVGAQATADGKISTFYSTTAPSNPSLGDLWVHSTTNVTQRWSGSAWNVIDTAIAINNGSTTINGGRITTNTLEANRLQPATGGTTVWSGGALVSQNFNGNAVGYIGAPTQGFRLSSNATGTSTDPNIYGAYIKGSTIDIETLKVQSSTPGNSGRVIKFQLDGYIYMHAYGTGFLESRVCSVDKSFVKVEGWYRAATNYLVAYLQYSTDGINWNNLAVKDAQQYGYQEYFYIYFAELFNPSLVVNTSHVSFRIIGNTAGNASPILISIYNN